jgi:mitochondrial fission protein ELM1
MTVTAWAVTTGEIGMRSQARGLAQAVADEVVELTVEKVWPWPSPPPAPPWPDIMISCGRRSVRWALAAKRASQGRIVAVHVQDPRRASSAFDFVVAMEHDDIRPGANVIKVATALHDLTSGGLEAAAEAWRARLEPLGHPLVGVCVGGTLRGRAFSLDDADRLIEALESVRRGANAAFAITPSRRTPPDVIDRLKSAFGTDSRTFVWDLQGDNPYRGILALADRLVVTSDSVSMISEALSAPHPVEVFDLGFARHVSFVQDLVDRGLVRRFTGDPAPPATRGPVNATEEAAAAVRRLIQERTGVSG